MNSYKRLIEGAAKKGRAAARTGKSELQPPYRRKDCRAAWLLAYETERELMCNERVAAWEKSTADLITQRGSRLTAYTLASSSRMIRTA
jgi:hypothetical protein